MAHLFSPTICIVCWFLHFTAFHKISIAQAQDTLVPNQSFGVGQTLVSQSHVFEMGFFSPGKSVSKFLGIWYKATPDIVVWVANRNNPITDPQGVVLAISENGNLAISRDGSLIWSANSSRKASNPAVQLLDTGNLVVVEQILTKEGYLWQSFDYPTDTLIPGMTMVADVDRFLTSWKNSDDPSPGDFSAMIENNGLSEMIIYRGKKKIFRTGKWNGRYFSGVPLFSKFIFKPVYDFREERMVSMSFPHGRSTIVRAKLYPSGSSRIYIMNQREDKWSSVLSFPRDQCDEYGQCGVNGICTIENAQRCTCLRGFSPNFPNEWDLQDWSGGCSRTTDLNCQGRDGFLEIKGVKHPDTLSFRLNTNMNLDECKAECLKNCSCTAFANPYLTRTTGCLMWYGDLVDTKAISTTHGMQNIYIRVPLELVISTNMDEEKKRPLKIILVSISSGVIVSSFINGGILFFTRWKKRELKRKTEDIELPLLKMKILLEATNNFSKENMIGEGGFGPVYKGNLSTGEQIAVKRLSRSSGQGLEEFKNEVSLIAKLQHKNLVRLLGCCIEGEERVLIYEYLMNKSLDYFVFDKNQRTLLTWPKRFEIIMGITRGLLYLHHDSRLKIIHRDFKTSNILLDENLSPKISDFGLARIFEEDQSIARTKKVVGTYGYMAPEYAIDGKFSVKSDVFSLGVVLLEIVSGRKNRGFEHNDHHHGLLGHAWLLWRDNKMEEFLDECVIDTVMECEAKRCMHVGLLCVQKYAEDRPTMPAVLLMLGTDGAILPQPKEPGFFFERSWKPVHEPSFRSENGTITITDLEAR